MSANLEISGSKARSELRKRVNHDKAITFNGVDQYMRVPLDERYKWETQNFGVSFFVYATAASVPFQLLSGTSDLFVSLLANSISATINSPQISQTTITYNESGLNRFLHVFVRRVGTEFALFVDGYKVASTTILSTVSLDFTGVDLIVAARASPFTNFVNGFINNFAAFFSTITDADVYSTFYYGGYLVATLHDKTINYWPLTEEYYTGENIIFNYGTAGNGNRGWGVLATNTDNIVIDIDTQGNNQELPVQLEFIGPCTYTVDIETFKATYEIQLRDTASGTLLASANTTGDTALIVRETIAINFLPISKGITVRIRNLTFGSAGSSIIGESLGTGDNINLTFNGTTNSSPITPGTFTPTDGTESFTDNEDGTLTGSAGGNGTINYSTGQYSITFLVPPANGIGITVDYDVPSPACILYDDAFQSCLAFDVVEEFNYTKFRNYAFAQGQGTDVGTFTQLGLASGTTNGDGLITFTSATGTSNNNLVGYTIPDPFSSSTIGTVKVKARVTSSGGINIDLVIRKTGVEASVINISAAATYDIELNFANSNNATFQVLLRDITGNDPGANVQIVSLTIEHSQLGVIKKIHGDLFTFTDPELGKIEPGTQSAVSDVFSKQLSRNWGINFPAESDGRRIRVIDVGTTINTTNNNFFMINEIIRNKENIPTCETFVLFNDNGGNAWFQMTVQSSGTTFIVNFNVNFPVVTSSRPLIIATATIPQDVRRVKILVEKVGSDANNWNVLINGIQPTIQVVDPENFNTVDPASYSFGSLITGYRNIIRQVKNITVVTADLFDGTITQAERLDFFRDGTLPLTKRIDGINLEKRDNQSSIVLSKAGKPQVFEGLSLVTILLGSDTGRKGLAGFFTSVVEQTNRLIHTLEDAFTGTKSSLKFLTESSKITLVTVNVTQIDADITGNINIRAFIGNAILVTQPISVGNIQLDTSAVSERFYLEIETAKAVTGTGDRIFAWDEIGLQYNDFDTYYRESNSGLPKVKEFLQLDSTKAINIPQAVFQKITGSNIDIVLEYVKGTLPVAATQEYLNFYNPTENQRLQHRIFTSVPDRLRTIFTPNSTDATQEFKDVEDGIDNKLISLTISLFEIEASITINSGYRLQTYENGRRVGTTSGSFGTQDLPVNWNNFSFNALSGDMKFISLTIIQRNHQVFNRRSMVRKWDNSLLATRFELEAGDEVIAHYNSNAHSYYEDGLNVYLKDHVDDSEGTNATVTGFAGGPFIANQLDDLLSNIGNINGER